jgi:predicted PhzF superfamily epimerase YddE/YHI9
MELPLVQMDAFTDRPLSGNPAAVMRLPRWLDDAVLQAIAAENNLSETAFVVREGDHLRLRWFTPTVEVDLCGHATLAAGAVLLFEDGGDEVTFETRSGALSVRRIGDDYELDLPVIPPHSLVDPPAALPEVLGTPPIEILGVRQMHNAAYWLAVYGTETEVARLSPDTRRMGRELRANVICTAPGDVVDFVSRFFAPGSGVDEDPVTGSAHATLAPFWSERLQKNPLHARQISRRGGSLTCTLVRDRVQLRGACVPYLRGTVTIPD